MCEGGLQPSVPTGALSPVPATPHPCTAHPPHPSTPSHPHGDSDGLPRASTIFSRSRPMLVATLVLLLVHPTASRNPGPIPPTATSGPSRQGHRPATAADAEELPQGGSRRPPIPPRMRHLTTGISAETIPKTDVQGPMCPQFWEHYHLQETVLGVKGISAPSNSEIIPRTPGKL